MAGKAAAGEPLGRTAEEAAWAETLRGACEPEHHWRYRREFLLRNVGELPAAGSAQLQRLVSLSMVWANHVFLGCRYPPQVMERALEMAEGIQVTNAPVHTTRDELVAKVKKRGISSSNEGVEEPCKRQAVEKSRDSKSVGKDVKTTKAEGVKETESTLPKKQEKGTSKDPETSQSTCSSDQEMVVVSDIETEGKPANAESTAEKKPPASEKEPGKKPCSSPPKESKCENVPSPEKKTSVSVAPLAAKSAPQAAAVEAAIPPTSKSTPQAAAVAAAVPVTSKSTPQAAAVPPTSKSTPQPAGVAAAVPVTTKSTPQAAAVAAAVPSTSKSTPQAAAVAAAVPPTSKSTPQTSAALLSSKTQVGAPASVPKNGAQVSSSLLLAPKSGTQVGSSLLLASKGPAKVGSPLLASKSSAEVAASLLAARSGAQPGSSLLAAKSSAQAAASLLAARSGAQQGPSRGAAQAGASLLASKSGAQAGESPAKALCKPLTSEDAKERQPFFNRLYKAVAWKLVAVGGFSPNVNHAELLNSSIQSVKATLDVAFVPLKELADLPQNKSSLENIVCELRCKSVYLGTGCGKSMENAKAVASREALKLFLKKKVIVKICKRKYKGSEIEDLVLLDEESKPSNLPPALRNPREIL
ncbi:CDKN2A-interacting protein isoform X1 [Ammospiza nelsoni]|uniref:CDKN2A-interacting protein isoform X1 n=1 Tax=Ammospiza caudacuta TaxID=2857398 RepID=UPI00273A0F21|nr:CDKN2A-interacting protein isoform X1 [Ammospiza caudacuta]XP_059326946.1 CDKN2A-interacting protein isoform X1 [Ammospiza nelsoni]